MVVAGLANSVKGSLAGRTVSRFLRFGVLRGLRSIEIDPEQFRRQLASKHGLWVPDDCVRLRLTRNSSGVSWPASTACGCRTLGE